jgi:hypothetical protein
MTNISGCQAKPASLPFQFLDLRFRLQPDLVTTPASFHPLHQSHGLPMCGGHGFHRRPGGSMFSALELLQPGIVAVTAGLGSWNFNQSYVLSRGMLVSVTCRTLAIDAQLGRSQGDKQKTHHQNEGEPKY